MVELIALTCGWFQAPASFFLGGDDRTIIRSPVPAWLIRHPQGLAVFDTGLGGRFHRDRDNPLGPGETGFEFDESAGVGVRLRAMGIDPADIRWVANSHFHADHCGGNAAFPNATIIVQRSEVEAARACEDDRLYDRRDYDLGQPMLVIHGEHDLFGDGSVTLFPTFGHTPGHQSARIGLPDGDVVLAADCCYLKRNLDELRISPAVTDPEASLEVLRRLAAMRRGGVRIFFGHDGEFWRSIPQERPIR